MFRNSWPNSWALVMFTAGLTASATLAQAHEIVGNRFFPATLAIDDPGVNDELAFPTIAWSKTGDDPSFKQLDISGRILKTHHRGFCAFLSRRPGRVSMRRAAPP